MLTRKQQDLLLFIHERMKESGVPPSFDEMKDGPAIPPEGEDRRVRLSRDQQ
ncbi:hypothetical protein AB9F45_36405, partial [Rhizobium leguminosarum]